MLFTWIPRPFFARPDLESPRCFSSRGLLSVSSRLPSSRAPFFSGQTAVSCSVPIARLLAVPL